MPPPRDARLLLGKVKARHASLRDHCSRGRLVPRATLANAWTLQKGMTRNVPSTDAFTLRLHRASTAAGFCQIDNTSKTTSSPPLPAGRLITRSRRQPPACPKLFLFRRFAGAPFIDDAGLDCFYRSKLMPDAIRVIAISDRQVRTKFQLGRGMQNRL